VRYVVFRLVAERYALPLTAIREVVVTPTQLSRVPRAPSLLRGVMNLRGRVVPIICLAELLESSAPATQSFAKVILLDRGRRDLGLLVGEVEGIETFEKVSVAPGRASAAVKGMARLGAVAITVLDPDGLDGAVAGAFPRG
jgi:purine-binding chemotaxis protein CheW